jgi:hypothetical protein
MWRLDGPEKNKDQRTNLELMVEMMEEFIKELTIN